MQSNAASMPGLVLPRGPRYTISVPTTTLPTTSNLKMVVTAEDVREAIKNGDLNSVTSYLNPKLHTIAVNTICTDGSTFLTTAVKNANLNMVPLLLEKGANIDLRETEGATPLLLAIHLNRLDIVQCLVTRNADMTLRDSYDTPLTAAVRRGYVEIAAYLLEKNADANICDVKGTLPILIAIQENKVAMVDLFLTKNINRCVTDVDKNTILVFAIRNWCTLEIIQCLLKHGVDVNESQNEKTPLAWAASDGNIDVLKLLVSFGADINLPSSDGNTALANAVQFQQSEVAKYLIEQGANFCKVGPTGETPLSWTIHNEDLDMMTVLLDNGAECIIDTVFLDVIAAGNLQMVQRLAERGALSQIENKTNETTPLQKSLETGNIEIVKYLLDRGTSVVNDLKKKEISTIVRLLNEKKIEMVKLLIKNGARVCELSDCGETILTKAIQLEDFNMVKYFLANGSDVDQPNKQGLTPLVIANATHAFQIFQYLVDNGATLNEQDQAKYPKMARCYQRARKFSLRRKSLKEEFDSGQDASGIEGVTPLI